jgi:hypothetical protein
MAANMKTIGSAGQGRKLALPIVLISPSRSDQNSSSTKNTIADDQSLLKNLDYMWDLVPLLPSRARILRNLNYG